ncbi:MAG: tryptophan--tRNA ligase [Patescibacteria group bacterium]|nr:tryptophan--tRNA ligase [Patescibacteria group bacterium]
MKKQQTIFSAIQPSGELHLGNYLGALRNFLELQDKYNCFFFIADYHSITENYDPREKPKQIFDLALDFLAIGLDPEKCALAVQSQVPEHLELAWIFNTVTPISELQRMTQFKDKANQQNKNINMGLFDYPVLQAADILIYKADAVPVGQDQLQHIELTRKIARIFNNKFGATFPEPKDIITKTPKIMSLTDPTKKMSKSHGVKSYLGINDQPEVIKKKIRKAVSTTEYNKNIYSFYATLLKEFGTEKNKKYFEEKLDDQDIKFSELKDALAEDIANYFAPFRKKRKELEANPNYVKKVLKEGAEKARVIARETMKEVKEKIGLVLK